MAESFVNVTEGAGKKLHTFQRTVGANTVEDEVVVQGEPYLASYTVSVSNTLTTTVNAHMLQIMAGTTLKVRIRRIEISQSVLATTVGYLGLQILRLSTAGTGGTAITPSPLEAADGASGATAMTLPTVKGTEGASLWQGVTVMEQTFATSDKMGQPLSIEWDRTRSKPIIIAAGTANGICLKITAAVAASALQMTVWFDESNF